MTKPVWCVECLEFEENSYSQLPGSLSQDYKYMHARQIPHQLSFPSQTIPNYVRYIIGFFCYNFKSFHERAVHRQTGIIFLKMVVRSLFQNVVNKMFMGHYKSN